MREPLMVETSNKSSTFFYGSHWTNHQRRTQTTRTHSHMARQSHQLRPHKHLQHLRSRKHRYQPTDQNQQSPQPKLLRNTHWRTQFRPKSVKIIQQICRIILTLFSIIINMYILNLHKITLKHYDLFLKIILSHIIFL